MNEDHQCYLWRDIAAGNNYSDKFEINSFRMPGKANSHLASWEPRELSLRWYRTFLNLAASSSSFYVKELFTKFQNEISLGSPVTNRIELALGGGWVDVNLDYLLTFEELEFLLPQLVDNPIKTICEIGAGFGRFAHILLNLKPEIKSYYVFDLPATLNICKNYLVRIMDPELFKKVIFVDVTLGKVVNQDFDLAIQIDGLQEMNLYSIEKYFEIFSRAKMFYSKNVVAKYLPETAGILDITGKVPFDLGKSKSIVDIWKKDDLIAPTEEHAIAYTPIGHIVKSKLSCRLFPHYLNLFTVQKNN